MKKWVVKVRKPNGRKETRLVPAKDKRTAMRNCINKGDTIVSCEHYAGQKVDVSSQSATRTDYPKYIFGYGLDR